MKNLIFGVLLFAMTACANLPNVSITDSSGNSVALGPNIVSYVDEDGKQITCKKETDVWNCSYKDENGVEVVIEDIDASFLEKKRNEQKSK